VRPSPWLTGPNYLKKGTNLWVTGKDILGNPYGAQNVDTLPKVPSSTKSALSDVVDPALWSAYN
jgi:hypothetical protein